MQVERAPAGGAAQGAVQALPDAGSCGSLALPAPATMWAPVSGVQHAILFSFWSAKAQMQPSCKLHPRGVASQTWTVPALLAGVPARATRDNAIEVMLMLTGEPGAGAGGPPAALLLRLPPAEQCPRPRAPFLVPRTFPAGCQHNVLLALGLTRCWPSHLSFRSPRACPTRQAADVEHRATILRPALPHYLA